MAETQSLAMVPPTPSAAAEGLSTSARTEDERTVAEARLRWKKCVEWEGTSRQRFVDDLKFHYGDSDNGYQWPNLIRQTRDQENKPWLTMNIVRQHNLMIVNQTRQNKSAIKIVGTGGGATARSASVMMGLIRAIERDSNATDIYTLANQFQVFGGIGYWRIVTDYADGDSFDQTLRLAPVRDPLSCYLDPDIQTIDGRDARFGFVFDYVPRDEFKEAYPKFADLAASAPLSVPGDERSSDEYHVWIAEYFRKVSKKEKLIGFMTAQGRSIVRESRLAPEISRDLLARSDTIFREVWSDVVEWKLIVGNKIIDSTIWPGVSIPIIRAIGEECVIDGRLDRKGHTRSMKDAQRMFNYNSSAQVEFVALQGKTPWVAPAKAIENYESYWNTANVANHSVLPWNHVDDENPEATIPAPFKPEPPGASPGYQMGMDTAFNQMMMTSGQWQNAMGMGGNERTGRAIEGRQAQADTSVFHFQDNFASALRWCGEQLLDLIPKVMVSKRVLMILNEEGEDQEITVDPSAKEALVETQDASGEILGIVFNPSLGKYAIASEVGPAWGTKRRETQNALELILTQAPQLTGIVGDLMLASMDFDKAQEAAQRLKRMVPKEALGQGPSQEVQALQARTGALTQQLAKALQQIGKGELKLIGKDQSREIQAHEAETRRIDVVGKLLAGDKTMELELRKLVHQMVGDAMQMPLAPAFSEDEADQPGLEQGAQPQPAEQPAPVEEEPPVPGARKAPDGQWYVSDPSRPGKFLQVMPRDA